MSERVSCCEVPEADNIQRDGLGKYPVFWSWGKSGWTDNLMKIWSECFESGPADLEGVEFSDIAQPGDWQRRAMRFRLLFSSLGMDYIKDDIRCEIYPWRGTGD